MIIRTTWGDAEFEIDLGAARHISTRLNFDGPQPNAFGIDRAHAAPFSAGDWVADTREGASVNCYIVELCPHGNGTHTECVGHIVDERVYVCDVLDDLLSPAWLVTVPAERRGDSAEAYDAPCDDEDRVVTAAALSAALTDCPDFIDTLVVRTTPNPPSKATAMFSGNDPTYLTSDAMRLVRDRGFRHLMVDFPSVDREEDGGRLPNHRTFWGIEQGSSSLGQCASRCTITEMIFVPDDVEDGLWCASFEIPAFAQDAAPSRIRLSPAVLPWKQLVHN